MQPLHVVTTGNELAAQPVKQRAITRRVRPVEVVRGLDNADAKVVMPDPVDECRSEIRVVLFQQPGHQRFARIRELIQIDLVITQQPCHLRFVTRLLDVDLVPGNRQAFGGDSHIHLPSQRCRVELHRHAELRLQLSLRRPCIRPDAGFDPSKKLSELLEVLLRPFVKRMLVALSALQTHSQEDIPERQRPIDRLLVVAAEPVIVHRIVVRREIGRLATTQVATLFGRVIDVRLPRSTAFGKDHSRRNLVPADVVLHAASQPGSPLAGRWRVHVRRAQILRIAACQIRQPHRPPLGIGRRFNQFVNLVRPFVRRRIGNEFSHFVGSRQRADHVE